MGPDYLALLRNELTTFQSRLTGDLDAPVEHCGDWTLRDLAGHLAQGNLWAATAVTERHGRFQGPPAPDDIAPWVEESSRILLATLSADPDTEASTFWPPRTVAFWRRRRWLETLIHRWDAENALHLPSELDPAWCADGIAEVGDTFLPRQIALGRIPAPTAAVCFAATDLAESWTLGEGDPITTLSGPAADILLALWNRLPWSSLTGDHEAARKALPGPVTP
ncbi:hypothetical protein ACWT_4290 [Actinoplanes sp. SE50]|uniref:maleylpyruvate isomerase family mycothiol-dependent enzyme n=1 Tax=unclassified Actinoplanes TaxID=2626549 RepID=UPI00023EC656|nr:MULTISPECIES: maleylpyruvate isomerase family mycothiol-dependent enzyme [unclassified Actinoplanes]AEV85310.1 hypothetical protein ACPL_4419 [Actinoplanes sp. SE50/110]ATO83705.1 hypothetical protein ACWT_4290 [Actinoplanes sp. SE50]SLM01113.1 hypothetical protein ACSP50_4346 [Actinoplanes sp. SE50/110]